MKIAFDAKRALNNYAGLGNYARILLNALIQHYPQHEYLLFSPKVQDSLLSELQGNYKLFLPGRQLMRQNANAQYRSTGTGFLPALNLLGAKALWRSWGIKKDLLAQRADIYHGLSNEIPFGIHRTGIATVATLHDVIFLKHIQQYPWIDRRFYHLKTKYAVKHAHKIIAVSQQTKADLINYYGAAEKNIAVIYPAVDPLFYHSQVNNLDAIRKQYNLPQQFVLQVGSFFPRKNHLNTIKAFAAIANKVEHHLVLVGNVGSIEKQIRQQVAALPCAGRIHIITHVTNQHLPAIYQMATATVFPSLWEGFGMPVAEALVSGTPVIATKGGAIEEAAGPNSLLVDPLQHQDIAEKMLLVLQDDLLRRSMIDAGHRHMQQMEPRLMAQKTMQVYQGLH